MGLFKSNRKNFIFRISQVPPGCSHFIDDGENSVEYGKFERIPESSPFKQQLNAV